MNLQRLTATELTVDLAYFTVEDEEIGSRIAAALSALYPGMDCFTGHTDEGRPYMMIGDLWAITWQPITSMWAVTTQGSGRALTVTAKSAEDALRTLLVDRMTALEEVVLTLADIGMT